MMAKIEAFRFAKVGSRSRNGGPAWVYARRGSHGWTFTRDVPEVCSQWSSQERRDLLMGGGTMAVGDRLTLKQMPAKRTFEVGDTARFRNGTQLFTGTVTAVKGAMVNIVMDNGDRLSFHANALEKVS